MDSVELIIWRVCHYYEVERDVLMSQNRTRHVSLVRQVAMFLCKDMTGLSFPALARRFSRLDHTTAIHAYRKIGKMLEGDSPADTMLQREVAALRETIENCPDWRKPLKGRMERPPKDACEAAPTI